MTDGLQDFSNVVGAQDLVHAYLSCLHVHADLGDLHAEAGHRLFVLAPTRLLADARIAYRLDRDAPGRERDEVQGTAANGVRADAAGTPCQLVYRDAHGLGHLPLQRLSELQDAQT